MQRGPQRIPGDWSPVLLVRANVDLTSGNYEVIV
jgi:hypothetical protein